MNSKRLLLVVLLGFGVYLVLFYCAPLPSLSPQAEPPPRFAIFPLLWSPEILLENWCGNPPEFCLSDRLPVLAIAGLIWSWAGLLGWLVLKLVRADRILNRGEMFIFSMASGLATISTYVLAVGLLGRLDRLWTFALPAGLTLAAAGWVVYRWARRDFNRPTREEVADVRSPGFSRKPGGEPPKGGTTNSAFVDAGEISRYWLALAVPFVLIILLGGMLPPIEFDVREYHLQAPKEFFQQGSIGFLPHNAYANMALGTEMFSLLGMVLAGDWWLGALAGKLVIAAFAPWTALALYLAGQRLFGRTAGIVSALVYISTAWVVQISNLGLVEGAYAFYLLLATYAMVLYGRLFTPPHQPEASARSTHQPEASARSTHQPEASARSTHQPEASARSTQSLNLADTSGWYGRTCILLAGYLAGAAVSTKYLAVLFVAIPLTAWLTFSQVRASARTAWKPVGLFLLACALGCGLWFAKNWAFTGNPIYPLLYDVFGGKTWTPEKNALWNQVHQPHDFSLRALGNDLSGVVLGSEWLSPLMIPLAALALLVPGKRRLAAGLTCYFAFAIAAWWLFVLRADRHWIVALPLVALLAGAGASWSRQRLWRTTLLGLLLATSIVNFLLAAGIPAAGGYNRYFVPLNRLRNDPQRLDAWHRYFNTRVTHGRILLVGEAQVFDLEPSILYNVWVDDSWFERIVKDHSADEIRRLLREHDVSYLYVHWGEVRRYRDTNYGRWDFVQPEIFDRLVAEGILERLPDIPGHPGKGYRVVNGS
jgi:hypothetical protein